MQGTDYSIKSNTSLGQEQERFSHGHCSALLTLAGDRQILHPHQPIVPADAATGRQTHHAPQLTITAAGLTTPLIPILPPDSLTPPNPPEPSGRKEAKSGDSNMRLLMAFMPPRWVNLKRHSSFGGLAPTADPLTLLGFPIVVALPLRVGFHTCSRSAITRNPGGGTTKPLGSGLITRRGRWRPGGWQNGRRGRSDRSGLQDRRQSFSREKSVSIL